MSAPPLEREDELHALVASRLAARQRLRQRVPFLD